MMRSDALSKADLKRYAISRTLFPPQTLAEAVRRLGFVQADPIRAPARAQDLILRLRVENYRVDDLERAYPSSELEEDFLYAYGFMPRATWRLLHPRPAERLDGLRKRTLELARAGGSIHPRDVAKRFGGARVVNAWGGYSQEAKRVLEDLHHQGHLRVAGRDKGIRLYEAATPPEKVRPPRERFVQILAILLRVMAPVEPRTLLAECLYLKYILPSPADRRKALARLLASGEAKEIEVDGRLYLVPGEEEPLTEMEQGARFLAPFDPLVRDRNRFAHLWGWEYRFEAYTPLAKRVRGYYAMPLLWRRDMVGWVNARVEGSCLSLEVGYASEPPREAAFRSALEEECGRFARFLGLIDSAWQILR